ncbi:Prefoldin [Jimgerdemannia flammicorona]|uniref:Prefoldin n=1 Tax=Jimgerdemannia flammicorona TaxID=994334 RepID=A0A433CY36_9FUNG|nr:Prefoldin [Jimgerdemannia flammicorona]
MSASKERTPTETEIMNTYNQYKSELQSLAQKVGELEAEVEEHKLVIDTIAPLNSDRKCFRMVGGVLVERTVKDVLPALKTNYEGVSSLVWYFWGVALTSPSHHWHLTMFAISTWYLFQINSVIQQFLQSYKRKEDEFVAFQKKYNIQIVARQ